MARYSKAETERKKQQGKELYVKRFDVETIAEIIQISAATVMRWSRDDNWEEARKAKILSLSELRAIILDSFSDLIEGHKPKVRPDEAAKYAAAFERLSDKRKVLSYMYESFEMLTDELIKDVQLAASKKEKEFSLLILKTVRTKTDKVLTSLTSEVLNEN